jgi:D-alanyl-lipoteichoic acid acyltransferase DltB (MBOAT superfamily)
MTINSFKFLGFILLTLIIYRLFPVKRRWWVLFVASIVFYLSFSVGGIFVMIVTALITYFAGIKVQKYKDEYDAWLSENKSTADKDVRKSKKNFYRKKQNLIVSSTIAITIGILFICKYYGVLATNINSMFNINMWTAENILLPLGISYYSLQLIGYLVDVNRDIITAERNPLKVILYGSFFLSIMQGPFNRYNDLMPQICDEERKKMTYIDFKFAIIRIVGGYIKKMCIADQLGIVTNEVFTNYNQYSGLGILFGVVCFAAQLYADFSGYMDIIIGVGNLFGIKMPENFRQPFFSRNMSEFWQRWHITLGLWLKDYVFYPILKSKVFKNFGKRLSKKIGKTASRRIPTYFGMLILWTLIGLWHGAGFNYVFGVGILQFLYIFLGEISAPISKKAKKLLHIDDKKLYWHIFQSLRSTALMMFAWIFFNSKSFTEALQIIKRLFVFPRINQLKDIVFSDIIDGKRFFVYIISVIFAVILVDLLHENGKSIRSIICQKSYPVRLLFYLTLAFIIIIFGAYGERYIASNFIYIEF